MTVSFRLVGAEEAESLAAVHRACFPHYWNPEAFTDFFAVAGTFAWVAQEEGGRAVAMLVLQVAGEQADIITIAVLPEYRRRGIARALVEASLAAAAQGAEKMFLDVEDGNAAAIALYEQFGFTHLRRRKQYYRQKDGSFTDALVMCKRLVVDS